MKIPFLPLFPVAVIFVSVLALPAPCSAEDAPFPRSGTSQTIRTLLGGQSTGFLRYRGQHHGHQVIALSGDTGSAIPSENLRLYVKTGDEYRLMMEIPMLLHHGFICRAKGDTLDIFLVKHYDDTVKEGDVPFLTVNLDDLMLAITGS